MEIKQHTTEKLLGQRNENRIKKYREMNKISIFPYTSNNKLEKIFGEPFF